MSTVLWVDGVPKRLSSDGGGPAGIDDDLARRPAASDAWLARNRIGSCSANPPSPGLELLRHGARKDIVSRPLLATSGGETATLGGGAATFPGEDAATLLREDAATLSVDAATFLGDDAGASTDRSAAATAITIAIAPTIITVARSIEYLAGSRRSRSTRAASPSSDDERPGAAAESSLARRNASGGSASAGARSQSALSSASVQ